MIEATAHSAFVTYKDALENGWLRQGTWNGEEDGRRVACALGVIDPELDSPSLCPAAVMPKWLARMVPWLFDGQKAEDAFSWGEAFYEQLDRLNGQVPFEVVYDWHANYSWPMGIEALEKMGHDTTAQKSIQELHRRAMTGDRAPREEWYKALKNAYAYAYADTYADTYANVYAYANAYADADANVYAYANAYADADTYTYAYADANVYANAYADAYANADANVYADADANVYTYAYANAYADAYADARKAAIARLAIGLVECMKRISA